MQSLRFLPYCLAIAVIPAPAIALEPAALTFDCDVPIDHYSSVSKDASGGSYLISGTISLAQLRTGQSNLPTAGARIASPDDDRAAGVQFIVQDRKSKSFDVVLYTRIGTDNVRKQVGKIDSQNPVAFRLAVSSTGSVTLHFGGQAAVADLSPMPASKMAAFCSTGQFKFSDLLFSP